MIQRGVKKPLSINCIQRFRRSHRLKSAVYIQNILNGSKLQNENESENKNSNKNRNENEKLNENKNESKNDENEFFYQNTDFDQNSVFKPDFIGTRSTHILSNLKEKNNNSENNSKVAW